MSMKKVKLSENAQKVAETRYFLDGEDWEGCARRVANAVAAVEKDKVGYEAKFFDMIYNMSFLPAGRILRNTSRSKGNLLNCFLLPIGDSIEQIGDYIKNSLITWSNGGGVGASFSELRPKGDPILGKGGTSSGLVSFIEAANSVSKTIESGGQRRAAALACVDVSHPEIIDFINAKMIDGKLSHFNISVMVNDDFLKAVEKDEMWTFKFKQKDYHSMPARDIWKLIITNMIKYAEPGLLNGTNLKKNNSWYYDPIIATNPCIIGETLVYVADGRMYVSIKQLADEGKDVPVYSMNSNGVIEIKIMRNPRVTGTNMKILKVTLSDGSIIRCTENHKFIMNDNSLKEAREFIIGDILNSMSIIENTHFKNKDLFSVLKIEDDGYADVYNGTVDDNHNFYIKIKDSLSQDKKHQQNQILIKNCGEATLPAWGSCDLGSLVLPNFVTGTTNTNWKKLEQVIKLAVRFLDNVLDVTEYPLKELELNANNSRRIGLGIVGLAEYLFAKEARYGSPKALFEIERLMKFIRDTAYEAGVELAIEKGAFPKFDSTLFGNSSFVRKLPAELRMKIKEKGIRCVTLMSMAPTGTISLLCETSSGVEPLIYKSYRRSDRVSDRVYIHPKYKELLLSGEPVPDWFVDIGDLKPEDHLETQCLIQKYTDGAVSKTINLPYGTTYEELNKLLLEYIYEIKGLTIYVDGSKEGQVYTRLTEEETMDNILNSELEIKNDLTEEDKACGLCEKKTP